MRRRARSLSSGDVAPESLTPLTAVMGKGSGSKTDVMVPPKSKILSGFNWSYYSNSNSQNPLKQQEERSGGDGSAEMRDHSVPEPAQQGNLLESADKGSLTRSSPTELEIHLEQYEVTVSHFHSPPANAPTAPASLRRATNSPVPQIQPKPLATGRSEAGKWSQSKRWMSQETKERVAFQKMMLNLRYMGADKSPFVPQNPAELTAFKADTTEVVRKRLAHQVNRLLTKCKSKKNNTEPSKDDIKPTAKLLSGKQLRDNLSPVLAIQNCFNKDNSSDEEDRVDWPSLAELKEEGDKRASRYGRCFPLPRLNLVASRILSKDRETAFNPDGTIRWDKKEVKLPTYHLPSIMQEPEPFFVHNSQLQEARLPGLLQGLLDEISGDDTTENGND